MIKHPTVMCFIVLHMKINIDYDALYVVVLGHGGVAGYRLLCSWNIYTGYERMAKLHNRVNCIIITLLNQLTTYSISLPSKQT